MNIDLVDRPILVTVFGIIFTLIYFAIIAFVIIFIVKSVKYFKRQELLLREISSKLDRPGL